MNIANTHRYGSPDRLTNTISYHTRMGSYFFKMCKAQLPSLICKWVEMISFIQCKKRESGWYLILSLIILIDLYLSILILIYWLIVHIPIYIFYLIKRILKNL